MIRLNYRVLVIVSLFVLLCGRFVQAQDIPPYLDAVDYRPQDADHFDLVNSAYQLTDAELALLEANGFVVSDRLSYEDFIHAYAWIYWQDLPVIITTDSMLQSVHYMFDESLLRTEELIFKPMLEDMIHATLAELQATDVSANMEAIKADLDTYLSVALMFLDGDLRALITGEGDLEDVSADVQHYVELVLPAEGVQSIALFDSANRTIDLTRFRPVGHYTRSENLVRYWIAMTWLAQVDIRLVDYDVDGSPILNQDNVAAAILLHDVMNTAGTRESWQTLDGYLEAFFGVSDNTTFDDLDRLVMDAGFDSAQDSLTTDGDFLLELLTSNDYGQQRISGQIITVLPANTAPVANPVSFMFMGQRFTVESYVMSQLTYDRLLVDNKLVRRPFPSPFDVMYALGNDRALDQLAPEIERYGYQTALDEQRTMINSYSDADWHATQYMNWLNVLRELNAVTTDDRYPQAMQTTAWGDKTLQTQLASWAQLRHDTLLYAEQSYTGVIACEYPAGYVEPYPEFYAALADYARAGYAFHNMLPADDIPQQELQNTVFDYYLHLEQVAMQLQSMSEAILADEPFTPEQEAFFQNMVVLQSRDGMCGLRQEEWDGWYARLFPWYAEFNLDDMNEYNPYVIAQVHTNTNTQDPDLLPPGVLHVGTARVSTELFIMNSEDSLAIYAGPVFSYYEFIEDRRLNDLEWAERAWGTEPPIWTASFRVPAGENMEYLVPGISPNR